MRRTTTFKMDDKEVVVYELKVRDYKELLGKFGGNIEMTPALFLENFSEIMPKATNLSMEDILDMAPSEIMVIYENFKECNETFFGLLDKIGLGTMLDSLKEALKSDLSKAFVKPYNTAIAESSIME